MENLFSPFSFLWTKQSKKYILIFFRDNYTLLKSFIDFTKPKPFFFVKNVIVYVDLIFLQEWFECYHDLLPLSEKTSTLEAIQETSLRNIYQSEQHRRDKVL